MASVMHDRHIPWMLKTAVQSVLSAIPGGEIVNYHLQRLNGRYTPETMRRRIFEQASKIKRLIPYFRGKVVVEIGTGWELISPLLFHIFGAREIYTVDHLRHLRFDVVRLVLSQLDAVASSEKLRSLRTARTLDELLARASIHYLAPADTSELPTGVADFFYTHEVLEHIPESELMPLIFESRRILKPGGVAYHAIEPGDHHGANGSHINHLRYSESLWRLLASNNVYSHNRLSAAHFIGLFESAGAKILDIKNKTNLADIEALCNGFPRALRFSTLPAEELAVWYSEILLRF